MKRHQPIGEGFGISPGRVSWVHAPDVMDWKDSNQYWWELSNFDQKVMDSVVETGLKDLTGETRTKSAWDQIFRYHNTYFKDKNTGYQPGQKIAIKVNMNGSGEWGDDYSGKSQMSYANPVLLKSLLKSLVRDAGVSPKNITVFDAARIFPDYFTSYCSEGDLVGIHFAGRNETVPDYGAPVVWSKSFGSKTSYFPSCLTKADYLINLANLKGHCWGVTLLAKNHFGTIINQNRYMPPVDAKLHQFVLKQKYNQYSALTDLLLNYQLGEKTILYGLDAVVSTQTEGTNITKENSKWTMAPFDHDQTKSLFLSQDPIALDSVGIDFLTNEPAITKRNSAPIDRKVDHYLHEAATHLNPPSKTKYQNGRGEVSKVRGVHEHWDNLTSKAYSRNKGKDEGIELRYIKI